MKTQTLIKILLLASSVALMSACGSKKIGVGSADSASRVVETSDNSNTYNKEAAECNANQVTFLKAQIMTYRDAAGIVRPEAIRMHIPTIAAEFEDTNYHVRFYRWKANTNNGVYFDSTPLKLRMENKSNFAPITGYLDSLNWGSLRDAASKGGATITTAQALLENSVFVIDLKDYEADYDALKIAIYNGNTKVSEMDLLIPAFYADPRAYKASRPSVLYGIHPFSGQETAAWDSAHYLGILKEECF